MDNEWFLIRLALATLAAFLGGTSLFLWNMAGSHGIRRRQIVDIFDNEIEVEVEGVVEADTAFPSPLAPELIVSIAVSVQVREVGDVLWHDTGMHWHRAHGLRISDGTGVIVIPDAPKIRGAPNTSMILAGADVPSMIVSALRTHYGDVAADFTDKQVRLAVRQIPVGFKVRAQCVARRVDGVDRFDVRSIVSAAEPASTDEEEHRRGELAMVFASLFVVVAIAFFGTLLARFGIQLW